jgi:hypothetical protein
VDFNQHSEIQGKHAFLSPSNYHWINYTDQKLSARYRAANAAARGTALHNLAKDCIKLGVKLSKAYPTLSMYVADAIAYKMAVEQELFYSINCFGTADTISFRRGMLRIHDLKTGITPASFNQLYVYAAIFCLEYSVSPFEIKMEFRIYQNDDVLHETGDPNHVAAIMEKIIDSDMKLEHLKQGGEL